MATTTKNKIELISWWFIHEHYEKSKESFTVPSAIKYLIRNFSMKVFSSSILTFEQDLKLIQMLTAKSFIKTCKFLYRASENEYLASKFHQLCDNKGATITIIKSECGSIFGGYTNISWTSENVHAINSNKTFLFLLKHKKKELTIPMKFEHETHDWWWYEIVNCKDAGPIFGDGEPTLGVNYMMAGLIVTNKCNTQHSHCEEHSYFNKDKKALCNFIGISDHGGSTTKFLIDEYEVFQIIS